MEKSNSRPIPWVFFISKLIGARLLVLVGLSLVILMFGTGTPMARLIPSEGVTAYSTRSTTMCGSFTRTKTGAR